MYVRPREPLGDVPDPLIQVVHALVSVRVVVDHRKVHGMTCGFGTI